MGGAPDGFRGDGLLTCEEPAPGLRIWQRRRGFRYALDPFLLAGFALEAGRPRTFLDVGTGSGIVALLLARLGLSGTGIDVRPEWKALAERSARDSGLEERVRFVADDVRKTSLPPVDLVLANPPYRALGRGSLSPDPLKASAHHELAGTLDELLQAMARLGERVVVVVPTDREAEARAALERTSRPVSRILRLGGTRTLIEGRSDGVSPSIEEAPLREGGGYGLRVRGLYARTGARLTGTNG
jgi:tRNA1Val (adenine37-N6)-methyltransferase